MKTPGKNALMQDQSKQCSKFWTSLKEGMCLELIPQLPQ